MKTFKIEGMHCASCVKLIQMELEEAGLSEHVSNISEEGRVTLAEGITEEQMEAVKKVISNMKDYTISE